MRSPSAGLEEIERKGSQKAVASLVLGSHRLLNAAPRGGMHLCSVPAMRGATGSTATSGTECKQLRNGFSWILEREELLFSSFVSGVQMPVYSQA